MAEIQPLKGVRYNRELITDLGAVICPPYDVISPQLQQELYQRSDYNFIRIEYNPGTPQDTEWDNRYTRSAAALEQWLQQGILKADNEPALYLHDHHFAYQGKGYKRRELIAGVRLEEWATGTIKPHEGTLGEPKQDRINMLRACRANTSPIMALYQDEHDFIGSLLAPQREKEPAITIAGAEAEIHYVWSITDDDVVDRIRGFLADRPLYIADGHHRYESALAYRHEMSSSQAAVTGDEGFNFVMMALISFGDPGLMVLPPHRLVRGISRKPVDELMTNLQLFFDISELSLETEGVWEKLDGILCHEKEGRKLVVYGVEKEKLYVLNLRDYAATGQMMPFFHSEAYKRLMVSVVDHVILEKLLEIPRESESVNLAYSYNKRDAVSRVQAGEYQLAFLLSPIDAGVVKTIADIGDRMPRKSTYFYPKLPSGLVIHRW